GSHVHFIKQLIRVEIELGVEIVLRQRFNVCAHVGQHIFIDATIGARSTLSLELGRKSTSRGTSAPNARVAWRIANRTALLLASQHNACVFDVENRTVVQLLAIVELNGRCEIRLERLWRELVGAVARKGNK